MYYLDTSAAVKMIVRERHSAALRRWIIANEGGVLSSDLLRTELMRAVRRGVPRDAQQARAVLDAMPLLTITSDTFERAGLLDPVGLRSLDAIHIAAALELGDELDGIVCYDDRLRDAAASLGIPIVDPR